MTRTLLTLDLIPLFWFEKMIRNSSFIRVSEGYYLKCFIDVPWGNSLAWISSFCISLFWSLSIVVVMSIEAVVLQRRFAVPNLYDLRASISYQLGRSNSSYCLDKKDELSSPCSMRPGYFKGSSSSSSSSSSFVMICS